MWTHFRNNAAALPSCLLFSCVIVLAGIASAGAAPPSGTAPAKSVLELFRIYPGQRTPSAMMALFTSKEPGRINQQPLVVLSDGSTPVAISVEVDTSAGTAPNFSCRGARFVSAKPLKGKEWRVEVIPDAGVLQPTVSVLSNGVAREIQLEVAPPLSPDADLSTKTFTDFLARAGDSGNSLKDLNGDNTIDYQDDYIFTVNFMVSQESDPHNPANRQKKALQLTPKH